MSNFYKHTYVVDDSQVRRVINTNEMIRERMQKISEQQHAQKLQNFHADDEMDDEGDEHASPQFTEGLFAEQIIVDEAAMQEPQVDVLEEARIEAEEILSQARQDAERILEEARQQADLLCLQAKEQGEQQGYEEGKNQAMQELSVEKDRLQQEEARLQMEYTSQLESMEPELLDTMLSIFDQVFRIQFSGKRQLLLTLVMNAMRGIKETKQYKIRVSEEEVEFLREQKALLQEKVGEDLSVEIVMDPDLKASQCLIDADSGVYDCSLDVELDHLIRDLKSLSLQP